MGSHKQVAHSTRWQALPVVMPGWCRGVGKGLIRQTSASRASLAAAERVFTRAGFSGATMPAAGTAADLPAQPCTTTSAAKEQLAVQCSGRILRDWIVPTDVFQSDAIHGPRSPHPRQDGAVCPTARRSR